MARLDKVGHPHPKIERIAVTHDPPPVPDSESRITPAQKPQESSFQSDALASWREPEAADPVGGSSGGALWRRMPPGRAGQVLQQSRRGGGREARRGWAGQGSPAPQPPHGSIHGDTTPHSGPALASTPETRSPIPAAAQRSARSGRGSGPSLVPPESGMHHHPGRRTVPPTTPAW
jgi:hypothetical protein